MTPSVSTLQRLTLSMHECWESLGPETLGSIRETEGVPHEAVSASVSLDGVMVPRETRRGRSRRGLLARGRLRHGLLPRRRRQAPEDPLSRPHAGERQAHAEGAARKRSRTHQASARRDRDRRCRRWPDNWTFLETLSPETEVIDFWHACEHLRTASDHAVALRLVREVPRGSASRPLWRRQGDPGVAPPS